MLKVRTLLDMCKRMSGDQDVELQFGGQAACAVDSAELVPTNVPGRPRLVLKAAQPAPVVAATPEPPEVKPEAEPDDQPAAKTKVQHTPVHHAPPAPQKKGTTHGR